MKPKKHIADDVEPAEVDGLIQSVGIGPASDRIGPESVIPILQALQNRYHYLPEAALRRVCETTGITPAAIAGVSTFYAQFRHRLAGRHSLRCCIGTACHVKGAENVIDAAKRYLGIAPDEDTDPERLFTVEKVACLGCCMLAPVAQIDDVTYGHLDTRKTPLAIRDFLKSQSKGQQSGGISQAAERTAAGEVRICLCSSCRAAGAASVYEEVLREVAATAVPAKVKVAGCTGISYQAPLLEIAVDGSLFRYGRVGPDDVRAILLRHFQPAGLSRRAAASVSRVLEKMLTDEAWEPVTRYAVALRQGMDAAYEGRQVRLATEHAGHMDPLDLDDYMRRDGFKALERCMKDLSPEDAIREVEHSGLRGRGGAGYPTGRKWADVRAAGGDCRYIICNGDEGDPGAFMDRMILESFPFRVIEGMAIAAHAVGATEGYFYIRAEYPLATRRVRAALEICEKRGLVGPSVMGSGRPLHLKVVEGAGAFVCGEETALIAAIEGRRGMPRYRPPYPSQRGLWGKPTLVNNVETLALVPWIVRHGAHAFAAIGTPGGKGTKTFALAGKVLRGGLIEVPMGITLREIVEEIGGGIQGGKALKAVQVGGPSGGCVPEALMDTPVDYEALAAVGAMMGSGGMVVLDETDCMVDVARYFLSFTQRESCGKCTHCRVGTKRMLEILDRLCEGRAEKGDIEKLEHLAHIVHQGSLCGLGRTAPNPVVSTLRHFRGEYEAHLQGRCPAKKCKALIRYRITEDCIGCTRCAQHCPADAIPMRPYEQHEIIQDKCIRCDTCRQVCPVDAVKVESGEDAPTLGSS